MNFESFPTPPVQENKKDELIQKQEKLTKLFEEKDIDDLEIRELLIKLLKNNGIELEENRELLITWTKKQEEKADSSINPRLARIEFEIKRACIYFDSGYTDYSFESIEDALTQAKNEENEELIKKVNDTWDKFENS